MKLQHTAIDYTGQQFGQLTAIRPVRKKYDSIEWELKCSCGRKVYYIPSVLRNRPNPSCGCQSAFRSRDTPSIKTITEQRDRAKAQADKYRTKSYKQEKMLAYAKKLLQKQSERIKVLEAHK